MMKIILLVTIALAGQLVKGANPPDPVGDVTCRKNHTVDIVITNVDDLDEWASQEANWRLEGDAACEPTFSGTTVTYTGLKLPDCSMSSEQFNDSIKYVLKVNATRTAGAGAAGQLRAYDHLYYVSCDYDSQNFSKASFVPIVNRNDNDTGNAFFTFSLGVYTNAGFTTPPPNPIALDEPLYLKAEVETQSSAPNLDLYPVSCWASSSESEESLDNKVILITGGCGRDSQDNRDTLTYSCTDDNIRETFSIKSFRFFGFPKDSSVYFHCNLRVCLADITSACVCPVDANCSVSNSRKRRSVGDFVEEIHVKSGPYYFAEDNEKDEVESEEQDEPQSFSTNLAIIVAVSGVVVVAVIVCATVYLVLRSRNKRRQDRDLNVVT